jgi:hypothetical protein
MLFTPAAGVAYYPYVVIKEAPMSGVPSQKIEQFLQSYILDPHDLVLTIKSPSGASVNIDGPFILKDFDWPEWKPNAQESKEMVIQPKWATTREGSHETSVHMHVPWAAGLWVRLHFIKMKLIDYDRRIAFYKSRPPKTARGVEFFFFYARAGHPLDGVLGPPKYGKPPDEWGDALRLV